MLDRRAADGEEAVACIDTPIHGRNTTDHHLRDLRAGAAVRRKRLTRKRETDNDTGDRREGILGWLTTHETGNMTDKQPFQQTDRQQKEHTKTTNLRRNMRLVKRHDAWRAVRKFVNTAHFLRI